MTVGDASPQAARSAREVNASSRNSHRIRKLQRRPSRSSSAHYDEAQIFEILLLCGFHRTVSYLANALKLPLEETAARFPEE
jgi:alkylhydroperoxidase family enzyme